MRPAYSADLPCPKLWTGYVGEVRLALFAVVLGLAAGLFARGSLRNLVRARFRWTGLLALYVAGMVSARFDLRWSFGLMIVGMVAFVVFAAANALPVPGMAVVGLGLLLNLVVTANNGGMPYRPSAVVSAGAVSSSSADLVPRNGVMQHAERETDQLMFLADVIAIRPLREVVSIGDIITALGLGLVAFFAVSNPLPGNHSNNKVRTSTKPTVLTRMNRPATAPDARLGDATPFDDAEEWGSWQRGVIDLVASDASGSAGPDDTSAPELDEWDHRIALLRATGDITVVIDLVPERERIDIDRPMDQHSMTARLAVARALHSSELRVPMDAEST